MDHLRAHASRWHVVVRVDVDLGRLAPLCSGQVEELNLVGDRELARVRQILRQTTENGQSLLVKIYGCSHVGHRLHQILTVSDDLLPLHSLQVEHVQLVRYLLVAIAEA